MASLTVVFDVDDVDIDALLAVLKEAKDTNSVVMLDMIENTFDVYVEAFEVEYED